MEYSLIEAVVVDDEDDDGSDNADLPTGGSD